MSLNSISKNDITDIKHILDIAHDDGAEVRFLIFNYESEFNKKDMISRLILVRADVSEDSFKISCDSISQRLSEFGFLEPKYSEGYLNYPRFELNSVPWWVMPIYIRLPYYVEMLYDAYHRIRLKKEITTFALTLNTEYSSAALIGKMVYDKFPTNPMIRL